MKTRRGSILSLLILFVLCAGYLFYAHKVPSVADSGSQGSPVVSQSEKISNRSNDTESPTRFPSKRTRPVTESAKNISQGKLYENLIRLFGDAEAERATLLSKTRHKAETWYLFGVRPPSAEEVGMLRKKMAEIQRQAPAQKRQSFDDLVGFSVDGYDPFVVGGLKGVLIMVPDDPQGKIHGATFSSSGFEDDKERFDPRHPDEHTFEDYRGFVREDGKTPERFASLVRKDPTLAAQTAACDAAKPAN